MSADRHGTERTETPAEDAHGETATRAELAWILAAALSALVAGAGIMIDADQWAVSFVGELLAWAGILLVGGWLIARGTRMRIVYVVMGVLIFGWTVRDTLPGGLTADEGWQIAGFFCVTAGLGALLLIWGHWRTSRRGESEDPS